ncbi:MAG: hypothetical protein GXO15_06265 [Crenarchaeota archaeon]|nr:hypothetical protein [Thermoproteota archaeon]
MVLFRRRRRGGSRSPRMRLLELAVATRYAVSRLGLLANRVRNTYMRTRDPQLKELLERILVIQAALEALSVRLETLASIGVLSAEALAPVREALSEIRRRYGGVQPLIDSMLLELENTVSAIAAEQGIELDVPTVDGRPGSEEVKRILETARVVAEERLKEMASP